MVHKEADRHGQHNQLYLYAEHSVCLEDSDYAGLYIDFDSGKCGSINQGELFAMKRALTFIALCKDPADSKEMGRALAAHSGASLLMMSDDAEQLFTETMRLRPSAVIINLSHMGEPALKLVQRLVTECPATAVICASRDSTPDLILRSVRSGARDFIRLPIVEEELTTVIERTAEFAAAHAND